MNEFVGSMEIVIYFVRKINDFLSQLQNQLISIEVADGIFWTEHKVYADKTKDTDYPKIVTAEHIRAAHIYNITFTAMRQNFAIAGLLSSIQVYIYLKT